MPLLPIVVIYEVLLIVLHCAQFYRSRVGPIRGGRLLSLAAYVSLVTKSPRVVSSFVGSVSKILSLLLSASFVLPVIDLDSHGDILRQGGWSVHLVEFVFDFVFESSVERYL